MKLTSTILNVAKVLSIVAFASIPSLVAAQSNLTYDEFDSDEIAIITNDNNSEHIIKEENAATNHELIESAEVIADVATKLSHDKALGMVAIDRVKDGSIYYLAGLIFFCLIFMVILAIWKLFNFSCLLAVVDKFIHNLISRAWKKTDSFTRLIVTGWIVCALPLIIANLLATSIMTYHLSMQYVFVPIFSSHWYETVITEYIVVFLDYIGVALHYIGDKINPIIISIKAFFESIKYIIAMIILIGLLLLFLAAIGGEIQENEKKKRKMIAEELEKHLTPENLEKLGYKKIKQEKESHGNN